MADKKDKPSGWDFDPIEGGIVLIFILAIILAIVPPIWNYIISGELSFFGYKLSGILAFLKSSIPFLKILGFVVAGISAIGTFIFIRKADAIWHEEKAKVYPKNAEVSSAGAEPVSNPMTTRWEKIVELSESQNISDWKIAIIEADIILDELLQKLELPGDTMGEKLQAVEKSDFTTIENAWEAHKARNNIAHEGSNFLINQREILRIISLYESVFREFEMI